MWRRPIAPEQVSPLYLEALLGYEDRWFPIHPGVNPIALLRAAWQNLRSGGIVSGGSTLTMQVARLLEPHDRTYSGKLRQILRALQLTWRYSKAEVLTLYLNHAPFGGPLEGVETASRAYLGKSARELSHAEAALLAVLPQAPSRLRPDRYPQRARRARDKVLQRLLDQGVWSAQAVADARMETVWAQTPRAPFLAPILARRLKQEGGAERGVIVSAIDAGLQWRLEERLTTRINGTPAGTSAAALIVESDTLLVRAYAGSADFHDDAAHGQVDIVQAARSPGSTLKPFVYALALEQGLIHSQSLLSDVPRAFADYAPENFDHAYLGPLSAAEALARSRNVPAVDLLTRIGANLFSARLRQGGLTLSLPSGARPNPSLILGGAGVTLEQLTGAYAALARGGLSGALRLRPHAPLQERRLLTPGAAWIVRHMLASHRPGVARDAGLAMAQSRKLAWKTGTSYGFRDAWAMGVSDRYVIGVWVGRPDGTPSPGQYGAISALPLLFDIVDSLPRHQQWSAAQAPPPSVSHVEICWPLGTLPDPHQPQLCHEKRMAWALGGAVPPTLPDLDHWRPLRVSLALDADSGKRVDASGCGARRVITREFARWPTRLEPWLSPNRLQRSALPEWACAPQQAPPVAAPLRIVGARDGDVIRRAGPGAPPPTLELRALGGDSAQHYWLLNGKQTHQGERFSLQMTTPGSYAITLLDETGVYDRVTVIHAAN
ncbi:putative penicillin-binding protein 1C [Magnetofaba australis IT-1]|uniref:peptidoglycan glycosyltransferase n=1 Tax=Magnetofaba australis IT-1 TaxID=1434232 RepID=A0A1Y2K1U0_9PROT|nr:putative penicillin-binding protein 1C [Magnetofaba australis IT-1]